MKMPKQSPQRQKGFSLVEILIALTLSLLLMAGILQIFLNSKQAYILGTAFAELQENGRFISDYVSKIIRTSGYRSTPNQDVFTDLELIYTPLSPYIQVIDNAGPNGSDILSVRYQGSGDGAGHPDGAIVDCLNQPVDANTIVTNVFSINTQNQLECQAINPNAPSSVTTAILLDGVENMQTLLGEDLNDDDTPDRYVSPNFAGLDMNQVVSIQISFLTRSQQEVYKTQENKTYNLLGTTFTPTPDYRLRRLFSLTIQLRNVVSPT